MVFKGSEIGLGRGSKASCLPTEAAGDAKRRAVLCEVMLSSAHGAHLTLPTLLKVPPDRSAGSRPAAPSREKALGYAEDRPPFATNLFSCNRAHREVAVVLGVGRAFGSFWGDAQYPSVPLPGAELQKLHYH